MIPPAFLQDLLARTDVVEIVGRYVQLKKAGINFKGLCPFHGEKTPSFTVSPTRQTYHCFGCGVHGNALGFLMEYSGLGFVDAVRDLAQRAGMAVPEDDATPEERARAAKLKERQGTLTDTLARARDHYRAQLKTSPRAIAYLKGRGLTGEIAARFGLGYAPDNWRGLASVFPQYDDPLLEESGLVIAQPSDDPNAESDRKRYDRFRDRIMFPIRSVQGDVIGFGGRVLDRGEPKYLNSPETPVFVKGRELYGLHEARTAIRQRGFVLVVEGYMDVVALAQLGIGNAVATLGTACTADHVHKLFRFTESVVFSFDGDAAGRRAAGRALEAALPHVGDTRTARFLFLPTEHDPDSYVREHGAEAFERCIEQAVPLSRQLMEAAAEGCDLGTAEGRARFLAQARPLWALLVDGGLKRQLLADLAERARTTVAELTDLWQLGRRDGPAGGAAPTGDETSGGTATTSAVTERAPRSDRPRWSPAGPGKRKWTQVNGKWVRTDEAGPDASAREPRRAPALPADHAVRMLLLHSEWWDRLSLEEHELLHALPAPHGELCGWLERWLTDHGPSAWSVLSVALDDSPWSDEVRRLVPPSAHEDSLDLAQLRAVVGKLLLERLKRRAEALATSAAADPAAREELKAVLDRIALLRAGAESH